MHHIDRSPSPNDTQRKMILLIYSTTEPGEVKSLPAILAAIAFAASMKFPFKEWRRKRAWCLWVVIRETGGWGLIERERELQNPPAQIPNHHSEPEEASCTDVLLLFLWAYDKYIQREEAAPRHPTEKLGCHLPVAPIQRQQQRWSRPKWNEAES